MARPIANPITYGTLSGNVPMSDLDTSFGALFTTGFNDSSLGWVNYAADTGVANAYAVTLGVTPSSYTAGMCVAFTPQNTNTGTSTINVNALGTKTIVTPAGIALNGGEIAKNQISTLVYDGTNFRIVGPCPLSLNLNLQSTNQSVNCAGYSGVFINVTFTAGSLSITLNNIDYGVPIVLTIGNSSGGTNIYSVGMSDPAGTSYTSIQATTSGSGTFSNILAGSGSFSLTNGSTAMLVGGAIGVLTARFMK